MENHFTLRAGKASWGPWLSWVSREEEESEIGGRGMAFYQRGCVQKDLASQEQGDAGRRSNWTQQTERGAMQSRHWRLLPEASVTGTGLLRCRRASPCPRVIRLRGINKKSQPSSNNTVTGASEPWSWDVCVEWELSRQGRNSC